MQQTPLKKKKILNYTKWKYSTIGVCGNPLNYHKCMLLFLHIFYCCKVIVNYFSINHDYRLVLL